MAKPERSGWDELERRVREWLKELERALDPRLPEPVRVPVPVRPDRRPPQQ